MDTGQGKIFRSVSVERLRELFVLDISTGKLSWRVKPYRFKARTGEEPGCINKFGYRVQRVDGVQLKTHRIVFAIAFGRWPKSQIDHANGVRSDNRPCNLREATHAQNCQNQVIPKNNTSGVKGVWLETTRQGRQIWRASISVNGKRRKLGSFPFDQKEKAIIAYRNAAISLHGEFANV